jgi:hypothetical protein
VNRGRSGSACGGVEIPIRRWVNIIDHRYKKKHITLKNNILTDIPPENLAMHYGRAKVSRRA